MGGAGPADDPDAVERRVDAVLAAASTRRTSVELAHISQLLPVDGPEGDEGLRAWFDLHPDAGRLVDGRAVVGPAPLASDTDERRERGLRFLREAVGVGESPPAPIRRLIRCLAVTGSTAYGEPAADDDLDFLLVTRRGGLWPVLVYEFLAARFRRPRGTEHPSAWCFNFVVDERVARELFVGSRGFLFAREALTARPVAGARYYRALIGESAWMAAEVPRLYARWAAGGLPEIPPDEPAPLPVRFLNAVLYPLVASYLVLVGLVRGGGRSQARFRVQAGPDRMLLATDEFETLKKIYAPASGRPAPEGT